MPNPPKPSGMDRREFLQFTGSGLLLSILATRTAGAFAVEDATFASEGFSLTLHFPPGGAAQLQSLRNPKTRFEWAQAGCSFEPIFATTEKPSQKWTSSSGARTRGSSGDSFEFVSRTEDKSVELKTSLQAVADAPILEFQTEFYNALKASVAGVTAFGPFRFALRSDIGPLQVHAIRRDVYGLKTIPVQGPVSLSGGRWNAPSMVVSYFWRPSARASFYYSESNGSAAGVIALRKMPMQPGSASMLPI